MAHWIWAFRLRTLPQFATDFFKAITTITSGLMLPLTTADLLTHAIVGSVLENLDMERLVREVGQAVAQRILGNNESVDDVARELHERLLLRNESTKKVVIESIYRESEEGTHNVNVFTNAPNLADARPHLKKVHSVGPFSRKLLLTTYAGPYTEVYGQIPSGPQFWIAILYACVLDALASTAPLIVITVYSPSIPPRSPDRRTVFGSPSSSFSSGIPPTPTNSPPRKVVTDFATFGAPSTTSVFGTAVKSSPFSLAGSNSAFAAIRGGRGGMDDDEDDEDDSTPSVPGRQKIELREGSITLDQVCASSDHPHPSLTRWQARRITLQSAWRSSRA